MNVDLPIISPDANPDFIDANTCAQWLQGLPLINVGPSHGRLLGQLEELNCFDMLPGERIKILELLREPVMFVQTEHAKKFSAKAVPLSQQERDIFNNVLALWEALAHGWERCLQALAAGDDTLRPSAALICQRALWCVSQRLLEHFKAYQQFGESEWRRLHAIFAFAEQRGVADQEVAHPAYKGEVETTCMDTHAQMLLLELANPNEQTPRHQMLTARWVERLARKVALSEDAPAETGVAPLSVDLASGRGASRQPKTGATVRYLNVDEVGKTLRKRVGMLRSGDTPESLGLGTDVPGDLAANILTMLYQRWCEDRGARQQTRRGTAKQADICPGIAAMHFHVTGQAFRQPGEVKELTQKQRDEIATFGRISSREEDTYSAAQTAAVEHWDILDESLVGFRLERPEGGGTGRFSHHQLLAVRPSDAKIYILCTLQWLAVSENYQLAVGTRVIPGVPRGVAIRPTGLNAMAEKYIPALALPAVPALHSPASIVVPMGWYRPKRVIEVFTDKAQSMLLTGVIERGSDFERCTLEPV